MWKQEAIGNFAGSGVLNAIFTRKMSPFVCERIIEIVILLLH